VRITPPAFTQVFEAKAEERQFPPREPYYYYTPHSFGGNSFYQTFKELFKVLMPFSSTYTFYRIKFYLLYSNIISGGHKETISISKY
jgi:hypothetical protein